MATKTVEIQCDLLPCVVGSVWLRQRERHCGSPDIAPRFTSRITPATAVAEH